MSEVVVFAAVLVCLVVGKVVVAAMILSRTLPGGDRCPNCDAESLRIQSAGLNRLLPWFRSSWCYECGWEGMLRNTRSVPQMSRAASSRGAVSNRRE